MSGGSVCGLGRYLLLLAVVATFLPQGDARKGNLCVEQKTCGSCVTAGTACGWCLAEGHDSTGEPRCNTIENLVNKGCDALKIISPDHIKTGIRADDPHNAEKGQEAIQLSPQALNITLRPNRPFKFHVTFRQAENYPVDLYYIMDLSQSMHDDKAKLAALGDSLAVEMAKITENFKLGFGSFVDKITMPYVSIVPAKLLEPCTGCAKPYGFKNQLPLTENTTQFRLKVMAASVSGNLDSPEGGFDAIVQAVACDRKIGWRGKARKLLVFATDAGFHLAGDGKRDIGWRQASRKMLLFSSDAGFHYAGDGKLGGIVTPNDGHCHLNGQGFYTESLYQDYPSISQLSQLITAKKVNVIFAITKSQLGNYERLSATVEGSLVGELESDSSNIVTLVKENYDKISSTVQLKTEGAEGVKISFRSRCNGSEFMDLAKCDKLGIGQNVTFEVSITVDHCPEDRNEWKKSFSIYPVGLTEKLDIMLSLICECNCEKDGLGVDFSPKCNNSGTFECGSCTCDPGRYGRKCECDGSDLSTKDYDNSCKMTNTSEVCEGKGQCVCGSCECAALRPDEPAKTFSGTYCECNDHSCDYSASGICSGPTNGRCVCGECECEPGFEKDDCSCPTGKELCRAKNEDKLICNGKGTCSCGRCTCDVTSNYRGPTCEDCPDCQGRCKANKACVQCEAFESGPYTKEYCDANCTNIIVVSQVEDLPDRRLCQFRDDDNCDFYFTYQYESSTIEAQRTKECPAPVNVLAIVLGVIGGIIAIGLLLLLLWKLLVTIHDRREFAKFEKERQNAKWDMGENPIYKQATSTFKNPMYANKQ